MRSKILIGTVLAAALVGVSGCGAPESEEGFGSGDDVLNVYSSRHYDVDKEVYEDFEKESGITLNIVEGKSDELVERVIRETGSPQADVFLTVGAESLSLLTEADALGGYESAVVAANIPEEFRGDGWMGMMSRARIIAYSKDRVDPSTITEYDDLTDDAWKGRVLVRSATSPYNQALLASMIAVDGEESAKEWAQGVLDNLAKDPDGNDIDQAKGLVAGEGDVAIMNSYYLARMLNSSEPEDVAVAEQVGLIFPKDTHVNLSYAGVLKDAQNQENAVEFLEFLSGEEVQGIYAEKNGEFPLNPSVPLPAQQAGWGEFTTQNLDFETFGEKRSDAVLLFDEVGWN